jgi:SDR family mycofactocin-dependent oxidoreductase
MGRLDGKVAFITGAARGQGRSHAIRMAQEGADVIALDVCKQIDSVAYQGATPEDLAHTIAEVQALDRRIVAAEVDVRDAEGVRALVARGAAELGGLDIVVANAGILSLGMPDDADEDRLFRDTVDINLTGVWHTVSSAAPLMIEQGRGGSIMLISSTQGLTGRGGNGSGALTGYAAAKHGVVGLMRSFQHWLAPHGIRVNSIHPTGVNTAMIVNEPIGRAIAEMGPQAEAALGNLLPVPMIEAIDVSNAIVWLASDEARYVAGITLPVDAGFTVK